MNATYIFIKKNVIYLSHILKKIIFLQIINLNEK
jgi:hypothetical protein